MLLGKTLYFSCSTNLSQSFHFCEVFPELVTSSLKNIKCFYAFLPNLGKSSVFYKTPALIFPDLYRRANHSSPDLINRSYYLCSFTDD